MTICIAAGFLWNYAKLGELPQYAPAVITASDRMVTAGDVEYEPTQTKGARITDKIFAFIAGDYSVHSQAVRTTILQIAAHPTATVHNVATIYGQAIQSVRRKLAEDIYLAPLGLNTDTFLAQSNELSAQAVSTLTAQMQDYDGPEVAALVVSAEKEHSRIYVIDHRGSAHCFDDIGFAAVGSGAWHARSAFIQMRYTKTAFYFPALATVFAAKRAAEVAPGVGKDTDIHVLLRDGSFSLSTEQIKKMGALHDEFEIRRQALATEQIEQIKTTIQDNDEKKPIAIEQIKRPTDGETP